MYRRKIAAKKGQKGLKKGYKGYKICKRSLNMV